MALRGVRMGGWRVLLSLYIAFYGIVAVRKTTIVIKIAGLKYYVVYCVWKIQVLND